MKYIIKNQDSHVFQNRFFDLTTKQLLSPIETQNYVVIQVAQSHYNRGFSTAEHNQFCDLELTFSHTNSLLCSADTAFEKVDKFGIHLSLKGESHALKSTKKAFFQTLAINFKDGPSHELLHVIKEKAKICLGGKNMFKTVCCPVKRSPTFGDFHVINTLSYP